MRQRGYWFIGIVFSASILISCGGPLSSPPGTISGVVILSPLPPIPDRWAYLDLSHPPFDTTITSNDTTGRFYIGGLTAGYMIIEVHRPGYSSAFDTVNVYAGSDLVNKYYTLTKVPLSNVTFQNGVSPATSYNGCADTYLSMPDSNTNHGSAISLIITGENPNSLARALVHFVANLNDYFSQFDASTAIDTATLSLYVDSVTSTQPINLIAYNLGDFYTESGATWLSTGTGPWTNGAGGTFGTPTSDTLTLNAGYSGWIEFDIKRFVNGWFRTGLRRSGFMLKMADENQLGKYLY